MPAVWDELWRKRHAVARFALAHHPTCSAFAQDMVPLRIAGRRAPVCAGCLTFWPTLLLGVPALAWAAMATGAPWWVWLAGGLALGAVQAASLAGRVRTRRAKLAAKGALGLGGAAAAVGLLVAPWPLAVRVAVLVAGALGAMSLQSLRLRSMVRTCAACPWRKDWERCPGFAGFNAHRANLLPYPAPPAGTPLPQAWPWPTDAPSFDVAPPADGMRRQHRL